MPQLLPCFINYYSVFVFQQKTNIYCQLLLYLNILLRNNAPKKLENTTPKKLENTAPKKLSKIQLQKTLSFV